VWSGPERWEHFRRLAPPEGRCMTARRVGKCGQTAWTPWLGCHVLLRDAVVRCAPERPRAGPIRPRRLMPNGSCRRAMNSGSSGMAKRNRLPRSRLILAPFHAPVSSTPGSRRGLPAGRGRALTTAAGPAGRPYWAPSSAHPWPAGRSDPSRAGMRTRTPVRTPESAPARPGRSGRG
jgi:hypothetical protein